MHGVQQKGQLREVLPFFRPQGRGGPPITWPELRQVIAEGGEHHVVDGLGSYACSAAPAALGDVRVLQAPANSTLRALVHFMPEPQGTFLNEADVTCARAGPRC